MVGHSFQGVKMIPPGPHMLTTTPNQSDKPATTVSMWLMLAVQQVTVLRWRAEAGCFLPLSDAVEVRGRLRVSICRRVWPSLYVHDLM